MVLGCFIHLIFTIPVINSFVSLSHQYYGSQKLDSFILLASHTLSCTVYEEKQQQPSF